MDNAGIVPTRWWFGRNGCKGLRWWLGLGGGRDTSRPYNDGGLGVMGVWAWVGGWVWI